MSAMRPDGLTHEQWKVWRQHHTAAGEEKVAYPTHAVAMRRQAGRVEYGRKVGVEQDPVDAYRCDFCGEFHIGRVTNRPES